MFISWAYARMGVIHCLCPLPLLRRSQSRPTLISLLLCAYCSLYHFFTLLYVIFNLVILFVYLLRLLLQGSSLRIFVKLEQPSIISSAKSAGQTAVMLSFIRKVDKSSTCTSWTHYYWIDRCQTRRIVARTRTTHCCSLDTWKFEELFLCSVIDSLTFLVI